MNDWCNNEKENYSLEIQHKFDYEKQKMIIKEKYLFILSCVRTHRSKLKKKLK